MKQESKKIKFIRYGGLSSVRQKGYTKDKTFHSPPKRKGVYAFVYGYQEFFLLGGTFSKIGNKHSKFQYVKDENGQKQEMKDDSPSRYFVHEKEEKFYLVKPLKGKIFSYEGDIWHHLDCEPSVVLERSGSWVKTNFKDFKKAFFKEISKMKEFQKREGINQSKDHLEVFIEKI